MCRFIAALKCQLKFFHCSSAQKIKFSIKDFLCVCAGRLYQYWKHLQYLSHLQNFPVGTISFTNLKTVIDSRIFVVAFLTPGVLLNH